MNIKHLLKRTANNVELGIKIERARIIALLDKTLIYDEPAVLDRDRLIALIEAEN